MSIAGTYRQLLRNGPLTRLFIGEFVSSIGDWLYLVALVVLVYQETQNPIVLGIVGAARMLPYILLSIPAGIISRPLRPAAGAADLGPGARRLHARAGLDRRHRWPAVGGRRGRHPRRLLLDVLLPGDRRADPEPRPRRARVRSRELRVGDARQPGLDRRTRDRRPAAGDGRHRRRVRAQRDLVHADRGDPVDPAAARLRARRRAPRGDTVGRCLAPRAAPRRPRTSLAADADTRVFLGRRIPSSINMSALAGVVLIDALTWFTFGGIGILIVVIAVDVFHGGDAATGYLNVALGRRRHRRRAALRRPRAPTAARPGAAVRRGARSGPRPSLLGLANQLAVAFLAIAVISTGNLILDVSAHDDLPACRARRVSRPARRRDAAPPSPSPSQRAPSSSRSS